MIIDVQNIHWIILFLKLVIVKSGIPAWSTINWKRFEKYATPATSELWLWAHIQPNYHRENEFVIVGSKKSCDATEIPTISAIAWIKIKKLIKKKNITLDQYNNSLSHSKFTRMIVQRR